ncbi:MAG TPA: glutamate 5-kinase, partial [Pseudoxanthomonas sp.]|nr:glutamate 5-kinase [Pseudoxanthomonas sp.]
GDSLSAGREVVIVSSGAVSAGRAVLHRSPQTGAALAERQAFAALGQARVVALWQGLLPRPVAQVLLTHDDLRNRRRYLNARATLRALLAMDAVPVINENDTVSVDELKLGDNDNLAAVVAALVDADALFIASDINGFFSANPRTCADAQPIDRVATVTPELMAMAGAAGSSAGTGGMRTKLEAAAKASSAGIGTWLFNGTDASTVAGLARGEFRGTRFDAASTRVAARKHWLRTVPLAPGAIVVDAGAAQAMLAKGASLLAGGILEAEGEFSRGDMVQVRQRGEPHDTAIARGISQYSAADIRRIARRHSRDIESILGYNYGGNVIHRDDLVLL